MGLPKFGLVNHVHVYKFGLESRLRLSCRGRIRHLHASNVFRGPLLVDCLQQGGDNIQRACKLAAQACTASGDGQGWVRPPCSCPCQGLDFRRTALGLGSGLCPTGRACEHPGLEHGPHAGGPWGFRTARQKRPRGVRPPPPLPGVCWERLASGSGTRLRPGTSSVGVSPGSRNTVLPPLSPQTALLRLHPLSATGRGGRGGCQWQREPSQGKLCATPVDGGRGAWLRAWPVFLAVWLG